MERATPSSVSSREAELEDDENLMVSGLRSPGRGTSGNGMLETVQESSIPMTSAINPGVTQLNVKPGDSSRRPTTLEETPAEGGIGDKIIVESGSESGGTKSGGNKRANGSGQKSAGTNNGVKTPNLAPRKSYSQLNPAKIKVGEGFVKNMTVETETVSSVPQVAVGGGAGERGLPGRTETGGSLRLKPSSETIRPRKDKKKTMRKAPSINSGTGGLSFRRFHHHHICSRAPCPEIIPSHFASSPELPLGYIPDHFYSTSAFKPNVNSEHRPQRTSGGSTPLQVDSKFIPSNTGLTSSRARTASSKADIFEAKVASAVDEANSSDSAETFVYESNPPEPLSARPTRYHSRTPSATSMASQVDHFGGRHRQDGHHSIAGKKSMKFANNSHLINSHGDSGEKAIGTAAGNSGRLTSGNSSHHHHVGRHNRGAAGHTSLFDNESPFPNAAKPLRASVSGTARMSPRVASPRSPHFFRVSGTAVKSNTALIYDLEDEGTDDERTPLVNSVRAGQTRVSRRPRYRHAGYDEETAGGYCRRVTSWILAGGLVGLLIAAVVMALIMCSKPLIDVHIKDIQNVLASEQEIMLDLHVRAINPNLVAIQVSDLDVNIFAKSKHIGTSAPRRNHLLSSAEEHKDHHMSTANSSTSTKFNHSTIELKSLRTGNGVDEGNDPIEDPEGDSQTMLLGQIFDFDSPLIFDPSPVRHQSLSSVGEVRLARPGNMTEEGGSDRWEKVLQHPFELIVRGVLRYSLPISSRSRSASIGGSVTVHPEAGVNHIFFTTRSRSSTAGTSRSGSITFSA